uniref:SWI/SNF-related matrix-associated actin-dependent regulator of chromatin subfamily A containing DEAD/H box 1 homolog n=1 Tax=Lygus hesperus TaxID=30085 RepID=A0A0A9W3B1_LYGHE
MTTTKTRVFEFMNDATKDELMLVNSVTSKKADMIIQNRPFKGWLDLLVKLKCEKYLGTDVLDNALEVLKSKHIVSRLMNKCLDLAVSTEKAVLEGGSTLTTQPAILTPTMQLKSYQMIGLNWLVVMHKQKLNGILADEMGLGKTIQVVAFIAYLREAGISNGPHLIVCPTSTIDNWAIEFTKWCPEIRVEIYHGSQDERKFLRTRWFKEKFKTMDVIVTSYQIVGSNAEERKMFKIMPLQYVVFDEAHMLKNMNTQRYGHLFSINATFRILLTGTPLQNNLLELMSLLNFVMPNMFSSKINYIKSFFSKRSKSGSPESVTNFEQEQVDLAKRIMKPFVMRRLKQDVLKDLPKKTNVVLKVTMDEGQKVKYNDLLEEIREMAKKQDPDNPPNFMSSFMQLRKLSNHPLTLRFHYKEATLKEMASRLAADYGYKETNENHIFEDLCYSSDHEIHKLTKEYKCVGKFKLADSLFKGSGKFQKLDELLPKLKEEGIE